MPRALILGSVVVLATASPAARPCSLAIDDFGTASLIADGDRDVPTVVHLAFSTIGMFGTAVVEEADAFDDGASPVAVVDANVLGALGLLGRVELQPATRYVIDGDGISPTVTFTTGAGPDVDAPAAPEVTVTAEGIGPSFSPGIDSCGGGGLDGGSTRLTVVAEVASDVVGVLAKDPVTGEVRRASRDGAMVFTSPDAGAEEVLLVAVDRAGNESAPVPVTLDFGGPGGCAQLAPGDGAALVALAALAVGRRRRRR